MDIPVQTGLLASFLKVTWDQTKVCVSSSLLTCCVMKSNLTVDVSDVKNNTHTQ